MSDVVNLEPRALNPGRRLQIFLTAHRLKLSINDVARGADVSRSVMHRIYFGEFPAREDHEALKARIEQFLRAQGATEQELADVWLPHMRHDRTIAGPVVPRRAKAANDGGDTTPTKPREEIEMLPPKTALSMAAKKHFAVFRPFDDDPQTAEEMYVNDEIRFVRQTMLSDVAKSARPVVLCGESGSGKSTIQLDLEDRLEESGKQVVVIRPSVVGMEANERAGKILKIADILTAIVMTLAPHEKVRQTSEARMRQARALIEQSTMANNSHMLLIEEAHRLPDATLKHLKALWEEMRLRHRRPMLGMLLIAQPELARRLQAGTPALREVAQRFEVVVLQPLGADLKLYVHKRLQMSGLDPAKVFDDDAVEAVRERLTVRGAAVNRAAISLCYPLAVLNVMAMAMNAAAAIGAPRVTRDVVRAL